MTDAGIRTTDAFSFLADEVGGVKNIGFTSRDAYNFIQRIKRAKIELEDTNTLIELFKERQLNDNMFSWDVQKDEFDRLLNFFWVDGIGKIDYDCFGDVIIFYTSYRLNKYNLVCAPFVGINNHWQNILLGMTFEFENAWAELIIQGNLQDHVWLQDLYRIRNKWSTAFNKHYFSINILSTQRSESTNNVCHGISKPTSSITDCFLGLEKLMRNWRRNKQDEDYRCSHSEIEPVIKNCSILKQAAQFYSKKLYSFFEQEFLQGVGVMSVELESSDSSKFFVYYTETKDHSKPWVVDFDAQNGNIQCSCRKFETMGLLCSHCIIVLKDPLKTL
ncbi:Protein FAR1-RELATED SEQUENCE 5 [Dendrobium catenatum]|uniref:Protein FAR1-RELATED SEQUENCE 5 n=1 Tax=Dendrobium catenatum TaxID=906689 RepID=A0A2I0WCP0_9ASPA|nr:Protein FAR1-RELATED SEQUENCE 5 [Dendrobium catenatum]